MKLAGISLEDASLLLIGVGLLLLGILGAKFTWPTGVATRTGKPMPTWLGRFVFVAVGTGMLFFEAGHLIFGWTGL